MLRSSLFAEISVVDSLTGSWICSWFVSRSLLLPEIRPINLSQQSTKQHCLARRVGSLGRSFRTRDCFVGGGSPLANTFREEEILRWETSKTHTRGNFPRTALSKVRSESAATDHPYVCSVHWRVLCAPVVACGVPGTRKHDRGEGIVQHQMEIHLPLVHSVWWKYQTTQWQSSGRWMGSVDIHRPVTCCLHRA